MSGARRPWAWLPWAVVAVFLAPVLAGLAATVLPAFGLLPAIGGLAWSLDPWRILFMQPGLPTAVRLSVGTGVLATVLALLLALAFCAADGGRLHRAARAWVAPLLATPHVAVALGLAFLIVPSGWLARAVSPGLSGWERPPVGWVTVRDPWGLAMVLGLVLKELPYLVLATGAALQQVPHAAWRRSAAALGYPPAVAWAKLVLPGVYRQLRLPVYAVLAFSMSNVELALILGPGNPPPLAVLAARWFADYDLQRWFPAAAAALLQAVLVLLALAAWRWGEWAAAALGRAWCARGMRGGGLVLAADVAARLATAGLALGLLSLAAMALWSLATVWRFPAAWPEALTLANWAREWPLAAASVGTTLGLALASAGTAVLLALACLEAEHRSGAGTVQRVLALAYLPLLLPPIAFVFGLQVLLVRLGADGHWASVAWAHLVFTLPYALLSLADPWRAVDARLLRSAAALGATPWRVLWRVRLPLLTRPLALALALAIAVSVGQYLTTLFAGAGRVATLTTEAVTLSSGADLRTLGVYAGLQAAIPLLAYAAAAWLPAVLFVRRRGMA